MPDLNDFFSMAKYFVIFLAVGFGVYFLIIESHKILIKILGVIGFFVCSLWSLQYFSTTLENVKKGEGKFPVYHRELTFYYSKTPKMFIFKVIEGILSGIFFMGVGIWLLFI